MCSLPDRPHTAATAGVALLGLLLSAYSIRRQVKRDTRSVKVKCRYSFPVGAVEAIAPSEMVTVEVLNDGQRPVQITSVGFELADGRQPLVMPLALSGPVDFPQTLSDGAVASFYYDLNDLKRAEAQTGQLIRKAFVEASGQRFEGSFVKR